MAQTFTRRTAVRLATPPDRLMRLLLVMLTVGVMASVIVGGMNCVELLD